LLPAAADESDGGEETQAGKGVEMNWTSIHGYFELALNVHRQPFATLKAEMANFKPLPRSHFEVSQTEKDRIRALNPMMSDAEVIAFFEPRITQMAMEQTQFSRAFSERYMIEKVSVTLLSHALCEATINTILAIGLAHSNTHGLFELLEKTQFIQKWLLGPMCFEPKYILPKDSNLYQGLVILCQFRNEFTHYKPTVHNDGQKVIKGSEKNRVSFDEGMRWIERFFDLPRQLHDHVLNQMRDPGIRHVIELAMLRIQEDADRMESSA
jgi:hypothetical protein